MIPGEYILCEGNIELNAGRKQHRLAVTNTGDRPIQVGAHFPFFEANRLLSFAREEAFGMRLDIPSGTSVRFEPGETRTVDLVAIGGAKRSFGANNLTQGASKEEAIERAREQGFIRGEAAK